MHHQHPRARVGVIATAWPDDWEARREGASCPMCADLGAPRKPGGVRIFEGHWSDAYLGRWPLRRGYAYVIWKGRHVAEPTELSAEAATGFWDEVLTVARAIERRYAPCKMNYLLLGNGVPHLHVHLVPRHADDPRAGGPIESDAFKRAREHPLEDAELEAEARELRRLLGGG